MSPQIGQYQVKAKVNRLGPIVWTPVAANATGGREANFESSDVSALPPSLTEDQQALMAAGLSGWLIHEYILPELSRRYDVSVTENEFLLGSEWQARVKRVLVVAPRVGPATVRLNEETASVDIPEDSGHFLLVRDGYQWRMEGYWRQLFPDMVREHVERAVDQLASAILSADEEKASEMARGWFPGAWENSPESLRKHMRLELFVLLFRIWDRDLNRFAPDADPLDTVFENFLDSVDALYKDYEWKSLRAEGADLSEIMRAELEKVQSKLEDLDATAALSPKELLVFRLEAALAVRDEVWPASDKAKYLGMTRGSYGATLYRARGKLEQASQPYHRLLEAIFKRA